MKDISHEKLKEIVSSLMFEPIPEVMDNILNNWHKLEKDLLALDKLDLSSVKPLTHINEMPLVDFLREDVEDTTWSISKEQILANAKQKDDDYIILTKVVK
ncbi:Asp-tRNA(Asn)/Glu-tRNA(Gln) amidotransferase subunit GatC [Mycoplasma buteonis]|uniref:Asp-tRNA(Asn)/Glu-tRNA(Gln) amidotransferase subunit GatC n=1 Tax=Mycoplasma buteonis TaxID=171280 RepID=UPI00056BA32F|nr:Asp-tRNA(Asn)/Glu-tRNA(Gln) amidotransferase subunit GatC [Mycoplasma buteonis]